VSRRTEIQVGLTVLAALAILVWGVTWLKEFTFERQVNVWHVRFEQTGGLGAADEVQVNGIRKGSVQAMKLVGDQVIVDLALANEIRLTSDSRVAIRSVGLMGERVIAVDLRTTGDPYAATDTIPGIYEKGLSEVMSDLGSTMGSVTKIAEQLSEVVDVMDKSGNLTAALKNFRDTSQELKLAVQENRASLRSALTDFSSAAKTARGLTTDREAELKRTLDQFALAAENMNRLSGRLDSLRASIQTVTSKVERGQGTLGKLVNDDKLYSDLHGSVQSFKALIEDIKANPKKYLKVEIF
jgi:phospholipid/cholesterol/gamma-HCH transport system substrate-binding protein